MIKRLLTGVEKNKLFFTFVIAMFSVTVLICSVSFCLWYMNIKNILHGYLAETIEAQQIDAVNSLSAMERSLNKTTYQILDMKPVHNILTGTRASYADYSDAGSAVQNLMSAYTGLQSIFIINEKNMQIYNQDLHNTPLTPLDDYMQPDAILQKYNTGSRIFSAAEDDTALICVTHDFRGYLVVYVFEKSLLLNQNRIFDLETQSTGLYYKHELIYTSGLTDFPVWLSEMALPGDTFLYSRDNYSILTTLVPVAVETWYAPFMHQMIIFSAIILLAGIAAILIAAKLFGRVAENYVDTLLSHSRQHHHTAIKATIQKGVRNQYISPADQAFLDDYFQKIQYKELFCMLIQLDRVNSILLSASYKDITDYIQKIKLIFEDHFRRLGTCIMLDFDFDTVGLILASPEVIQDVDIAKHVSAARVDIEKHLSLTVTTVLTDSLTSTKDILYTFSHLNKLKQYRFFTGYNSTITDKNEIVASTSTPPQFFQKNHFRFDRGRYGRFTRISDAVLHLCSANLL